MNARDKAYVGATAMFNAPQKKNRITKREREIGVKVLRILDECTDDEMAMVLMACIMVLGQRLAEKTETAPR